MKMREFYESGFVREVEVGGEECGSEECGSRRWMTLEQSQEGDAVGLCEFKNIRMKFFLDKIFSY